MESYRAKSAIAGRGASQPCRGGPPPDSVFLFVQMLCQECLVGQRVRQLQQYPLETAGVVLDVLAQRPQSPYHRQRDGGSGAQALPAVQQQLPAVQPAAPAPQAAPQPKVTAPQPVQTAPPPAAAPAPKHKRTAPANSYKEAEAALNERIRADHILLSNPVVVRGLGLAPGIGAALDGHRALMRCIAALILVTFTRMLAVAVCHLTGNRFRPVIYCYTAALLYIPTYVLLYALFGADLTLLGIYLPILVVEPAIVKRMEFSELEPVKEALRHGFNNALGMCVVLLLVGCLRELLATGAVFGHVVMHNALLPLAALPAGGFVILGVMAACWCAAANLYTDYKHEEVRRLYADRKH